MKKVTVVLMLVLVFSIGAMAAQWTGYVADEMCAAKNGAKAVSSADHAGCAAKCIKGGDAAVLVTEDGKVYKIADQAKVANHAGHKVTISGTLNGDTISVDSVKM
jgi:Protein of unknown function (DUF5818)/N-acetylmuramoyl-L-alanine amidase